MADIETDFVHLARFAMEGRHDDAAALVRRTFRALLRDRPDLAAAAKEILKQISKGSPVRGAVAQPLPVDTDSRLELLRREFPVAIPTTPVWSESVAFLLSTIVEERRKAAELMTAGVEPTRSALLVGPPGVGKTLAARWLASQLAWPLLSLDLAAVMSSYLGRTGNNIRAVLEFARGTPAVLLLDEFDAIAKRRDDAAEIGELKRLVNVLLQAVDDWPGGGLLLAATNHPELLDPAVWRRFDRIVEFPRPGLPDVERFIRQELSDLGVPPELLRLLQVAFDGSVFADIERELNSAKRNAIVKGATMCQELEGKAHELLRAQGLSQRVDRAKALIRRGHSQRESARLTGVSRDTLRKRTKEKGQDG
jgi:SpoVK/Ycf46/Vps4 family AAA+-type ATPase